MQDYPGLHAPTATEANDAGIPWRKGLGSVRRKGLFFAVMEVTYLVFATGAVLSDDYARAAFLVSAACLVNLWRKDEA